MNDDACPTCGSKNFGITKMKNNSEHGIAWKKQCYNCKKFWHESNY